MEHLIALIRFSDRCLGSWRICKKRNKHHPSVSLIGAVSLGLCILSPVGSLRAQAPEGADTTSSTTNDSTGIVTAVSADETVTVKSRRGPFTYRLGRDLHVVGPDGKPRKIAQVHQGQKVTVYYYHRDGQETVARLVILESKHPKSL